MPKGIYAAASAMYTERRSMDVIAHNLANAQSVGYRRAEALRGSFAETLADQGRTGGISGDGGAGIHQAGVWRDFSQGESRETDRPLDVALAGRGFLMARAEDGSELLTRSGHFTIDTENRLVGQHGWPVLGQDGEIQLPDDAMGFQIDEGGRIYALVQGDNGVQSQFIEQLRLVEVANHDALIPRNGQYFDPAGQALVDSTDTKVHQGRLENANIDPVTELVKMITVQRHYDAAQKALTRQARVGEGYSDIIHRA